MLCQACNKNEAKIHYKSNINGKIAEKYLCRECAKNDSDTSGAGFEPIDLIDGFLGKSGDDIFGGLFAGMMNDVKQRSVGEPKVCPSCGMRFSDFLKVGKIGCGECYNTFSSALSSTVKRIHGNVEHCGKVPENRQNTRSGRKKIEELKTKLNQAIENQEYEMAAKYRDEIREIEKNIGEEK